MDDIYKKLSEPFQPDRVYWKPQAISKDKTKALAVAYIDARDVAECFDQVVGPDSWQVDHKDVCGQTLTGIGVRFEHGWVWKWDVGTNDSSDASMGIKGAITDGLKRAAVLWGVGRYLYRLPKQWVGYDAQKKRLTETPHLPKWALPEGAKSPGGRPRSNGRGHPDPDVEMAQDVPGDPDPEGPAPDLSPKARFWNAVSRLRLDNDAAYAILNDKRVNQDFGKAVELLEAQYTPPDVSS